MALRKRRAAAAEDHGGGGGGHGGASGRWLVSYADFITLMFVVFAVLFSMARLDATKYGSLARSLRQSLGPVGPDIPPLPARGQSGQAMPVIKPERPGDLPDIPDWPLHLIAPPTETERAPVGPKDPPPPQTAPAPSGPVTPAPPPPPPDPFTELERAFQSLPGARSGAMVVALQDRGLVLSIAGSVLFEPGLTALRPEARSHLDEIAGRLAGVQYPIMVEGTTDEAPPVRHPNPLSPWDLSALRAGAVVRYLVEQRGLPASQFVTIGFGSDSPEVNPHRRVTIVVLRRAPY